MGDMEFKFRLYLYFYTGIALVLFFSILWVRATCKRWIEKFKRRHNVSNDPQS